MEQNKQDTNDFTGLVAEELKQAIEEAKDVDVTGGSAVSLQPRFSVEALNRRSRRQMKLPMVMWGCYNELGFLMTVGTFAKVNEWANNHKIMRNPDLDAKLKKSQMSKEDQKKFWVKRLLSVRPVVLMAKDAFKSPIKLTDSVFDLKTIKRL